MVEQESDGKEVSRKEDSVERKDEPVQVSSKQNECRGVESMMISRPEGDCSSERKSIRSEAGVEGRTRTARAKARECD